jgi:ferritin-like metal-binding protein YciE
MKIQSINELFERALCYAYDCEQKLAKKGIPSMIENASSPELRNALQQHLAETRNHVTRLDQVFAIVGRDPKAEDNDILDELTDHGQDLAKAIESAPLRDAALIASGNQVEHYEMALYGTLVAFAQQLGFSDAARLLQQTLDEEKAADAKLTQIAEESVNLRAVDVRRAA